MMEAIKLEQLFQELRGQTFVSSVNLVFGQGSSATINNAQMYYGDEMVYIRSDSSQISLKMSSIDEIMVSRIDQGDGLIIENVYFITA